MKKLTDIPRVKKIRDIFVSDVHLDQSLDDLKKNLRAVKVDPVEYRKKKTELSPSKNFWTNTAFGRTLTGRNKTGRVIRRVGGVAGAIGGSLLGIDLGILGDIGQAANAGSGAADIMAILDKVETIMLILAGIVGTIAGVSDKMEINGERFDEQEILENSEGIVRKITNKTKRTS